MLYLKAITKEGETEYFNTNNIISIKPQNNKYMKILMGAGLYWVVFTDSVEVVELKDIFK